MVVNMKTGLLVFARRKLLNQTRIPPFVEEEAPFQSK
jgi:hypothetical protein